MVRALGGDDVEVVDQADDAGADRNLVAPERLRIAGAVPAFVVTKDNGRHRHGERHGRDDLGANLRMDANLGELLGRERPRLRQDVRRDGELPDVVQQRRGAHRLDFARGHVEHLGQTGRVGLHAPDVDTGHLVFRVDGRGQRFNRRQVQVGGLLHVALCLEPAQIDAIGAIGEVDRREGQRRQPHANPVHDPGGERGRAGADEVARCAPQEVGLPDREHRLARCQRDGAGNEPAVQQEVDRGGANQRPGDGGHRVGTGPRQQVERHAGPRHRDHERGHAEQGAMQRRLFLVVQDALAERAGRSHQ